MAGLTAPQALVLIRVIESSIEAVCATAPNAVESFGGGAAMQAHSEMTCVGLVPRMSEAGWEAMAAEHAERQRDVTREQRIGTRKGGVEGAEGPAPGAAPAANGAGPKALRWRW